MVSDRLRVFVSSKMAELAAERAVIKEVLEDLNVDAWVFEQDAGARAETIEETYREQLEASDLYIGVFWKGYGAYTIDEFELAKATGTDCLIYQKHGAQTEGRDPRLQAFLDKIGQVETGLTVQFFDTPEELREMVKRDTARWQTRIVRRYREAGSRRGRTGLPADPNLVVLRNKVKQFWVDGVLGRAVAETGGLIDLRKESRPGAVSRPVGGSTGSPGEETGAPFSDASATEILERLQGGLLILGRPGSGKTTTALQVARDLIAKAERDESRPVPVVLNLSAWSPDSRPLTAWILGELSRRYHVPPRIGRSWLEQDRLVLFLDGLDEVAAEARAACAAAINEFGKKYGVSGLVVTSRLEEYEALDARLRLNGAVLLRPLEPAQVEAHLERAGDKLAGLRTALKTDETLQELSRTPLMVSVMSRAYSGRPAEELEEEEAESAEARSAWLFGAYVDRAFDDGRAGWLYSREALTSWLSWLARRMAERSRTQFLIEDLQPSWLATRAQVGAYVLGFAIVLGLIFGGLCILYRLNPSAVSPPEVDESWTTLDAEEAVVWVGACALFFLGVGVTDGLRFRARPTTAGSGGSHAWRHIASNVAIFALLWTPIVLMMNKLVKPESLPLQIIVPAAALTMGFAAVGAKHSVSRRIDTAESLALERASALRGALWGLLAGTPFAILTILYMRDGSTTADGPVAWAGLFWCLMGSAVGALFAGFQPRLVRGKTVPNQGMRLTLRTSLRAAAMAVPLTAIGVLVALVLGGDYRRPDLLAGWTAVSLVFLAVSVAAWFGGLDLCKHYLLRAVIGGTRQGPMDFPRVLNEASRRNLMQRVGGGYMFVHRPLQDHFAAMTLPPPLAEEIRDSERERFRDSAAAIVAMVLAGLIGSLILWLGLQGEVALPVVVAGALLLGISLQWLVIRSAVKSALGAGSRRREDE